MPEKTIKRRLQDCDAARLSCHVPRGADLGGRASRISGADRGLFRVLPARGKVFAHEGGRARPER